MFKRSLLLLACLSSVLTPLANAADAVQSTDNSALQKLIKTLVEQKVITEQKAQELLKDSQQPSTNEKGVVRIQQVPQFIQDDIRQKVKAELHDQVVEDVMNQAKTQAWGVPGTLPGWIDNIKIKTDIRLRAESTTYGDIPKDQGGGNYVAYPDYSAINSGRNLYDSFGFPRQLNNSVERDRARLRARFQVDTKLNAFWKTSFRLATGSATDPVSTNQTLGSYGKRSNIMLDQAFVKYDGIDSDNYPWLTFVGGRMANPFVSTDLVWDTDLGFEGVSATYRMNLSGSGDLLDMNDRDRTLFVTLGAFPLQENELTTQDKWLYGAQVGTTFVLNNQDTFTAALAYYGYDNIVGQTNDVDSNLTDWTAPQFMQKGNTLYNIAVSSDPSSTAALYALASDYNLVDLTASYTFAELAPIQITVTGDYVKNIAFNLNDVKRRTGEIPSAPYSDIKDRNTGYQLGVTFGWPVVSEIRSWNTTVAYRYLQADAVLDAFTDSDFHLGGTDAKGWSLTGQYAVANNVWVTGRYINSSAIAGSPLDIDTFQLDLNAKF